MNARTGEAGFTLIEMVLAMTIGGLVIGSLAAAMFLGLGTERSVQTRLAESNSANLLASYFAPDVQQSGPVTTAPTADDSPYCGATGGPVALLLPQNNNTSSVSYFVDPTDPKILRRRTCAGGATTGLPGGQPVVRNLSSAPVVSCASTCTITVTQLVGGKLPYTTTLVGSRRAQ